MFYVSTSLKQHWLKLFKIFLFFNISGVLIVSHVSAAEYCHGLKASISPINDGTQLIDGVYPFIFNISVERADASRDWPTAYVIVDFEVRYTDRKDGRKGTEKVRGVVTAKWGNFSEFHQIRVGAAKYTSLYDDPQEFSISHALVNDLECTDIREYLILR